MVVRLGDELYVRSVRGAAARWVEATQIDHEGRMRAAGVEADMTFVEEQDRQLNDDIDAAYASKCGIHPSIVPSMQTPGVRATTLRLGPR